MNNIKIFVSHRIDYEAELIDNDIFVPVNCGAVYLDQPANIAGDNTGENISERRNSFCEFTVQYWAWKNVQADYYGICHYRRYFSFADGPVPQDIYTNVLESTISPEARQKYHLDDMDRIQSVVNAYDITVTTPFDVTAVGYKDVAAQYSLQSFLEERDLGLMEAAIKKFCPDYLETFHTTMTGKIFYPCNMWIMKKEIFQEFCSWLYQLMFEVEKYLDLSEANVDRRRAIGHLAERMLTVFVNYKLKQGIRLNVLQRVLFQSPQKLQTIHREHPDYVPVVFASNDVFVPYLYLTIKSMFMYAAPETGLDIIILHRDMIDKHDQEMIGTLLQEKQNASIRFYDLSEEVKHLNFVSHFHISVDTFYRLLIPRICHEYDKVLYIDCDLLVFDDISKLYAQVSDDHVLTGTRDADYISQYYQDEMMQVYTHDVIGLEKVVNYMQAGVMAFNLQQFREKYDLQALLDFALSKNFKYMDQDILNAFFKGDIHYVSMDWNVMMDAFQMRKDNICKYAPAHIVDQYLQARKHPRIIHYAGGDKPWFNPTADYADEFWVVARGTIVYERIIKAMVEQRVQEAAAFLDRRHSLVQKLMDKVLPQEEERRKALKDRLNKWVSSFAPQGSNRREVLKKYYHMLKGDREVNWN